MDISQTLFYGFLPFVNDSQSILTDLALRVSDQTMLVLHVYVLASAILVSAITTGLVFKNARQMKGGVFGTVLQYFGVGMLLILLGFLVGSLSFGATVYAFVAQALHATFYIIGYVIMAIAAHKLLVAIKGER